ncbi:hypothetical protein HXX76_010036 [Chlamydomonas incerta]|uniref:Uncharacterized protein n=2 Tax=Chlamydomonas incerta TaxID=51695 RepID=A0A835VYG3_CHLIN|nr:hypothetical protein HXX76_010036 [Chlamydomonas incerta]|eukprot:KAG2430513.1 hypothetical protein HXX76_010036 [Chlamydomonas incerta]
MVGAAYLSPDAFDTIYLPATPEDKVTQTWTLSEAGSSIDGIKNLLVNKNHLGNGIATLTNPPANLTSGPGLQYLATAVQAYLALYGGVSLVVPGIFYFWPSNTNSFYHGATTYVPGGAVDFNGGAVYSKAFTTLKYGPLLLTTPPFEYDNIWTINFYDVYGQVYHTVGKQHGSNGGAKVYIVPPGWEGELPNEEFELVRSPTIEGILLGRTLVGGNNSAVRPFDLAWTLEVYDNPDAESLPEAIRFAYPEASISAGDWQTPQDPLSFWKLVGEVYRRNGAWHIQDPLKRLLPTLGLWEEYGFVQASVSPLALDALKIAPYYANRILTAKWINLGPKERGYWQNPWNLGSYGVDYVNLAAQQKFWNIPNKQVDAVYYWGFVDSDAVPYTGANGTEYDIEFPFAPPVNNYSFWSIVANRHPNVLLGAPPPPGSPPGQAAWSSIYKDAYSNNGTWRFRLSATPPPANSTAASRGWNWVSTPPDTFYLTLRLYSPGAAPLADTYIPPPVVRVKRGGASPTPTPTPTPTPAPSPSGTSPAPAPGPSPTVRRLRQR